MLVAPRPEYVARNCQSRHYPKPITNLQLSPVATTPKMLGLALYFLT
jgi:hypothetical protein